MPVTPFHFGPALFLGLLLLNYLDLPTFLIANVIIDVEPVLVLTFGLDYRVHGFFHSFLGSTIIALLITILMKKIRKPILPILSFFKIETRTSFLRRLVASLSGVYIHILLDSRMHYDIQPFYPLTFNPFLNRGVLAGLEVYIFCVWCFIGAVIIYGVRLFQLCRKSRS